MSQQPLLAHDRPASQRSGDTDRLEEEDALLTGQRRPQRQKYGGPFWRQLGFLVWAVIATLVAVILGVLYGQARSTGAGWDDDNGRPTGKRNLIFMVSDGMGPTSLSMTRSFRQNKFGLPYNSHLVLDEHLIGSSRTRSSSSLITDSAAGATAFSCAQKSYNGAISVLPDHSPCGSVLEAAKKAGYMTGLVVTTLITDATPACFASHVQTRSYQDTIAEQELGLSHPMGRVVDLMLGGGRCHFLSNSSGEASCRTDDRDVIYEAEQEYGWNYISNRTEFDSLGASSTIDLPLLGLFADKDIPYEIDRAYENETYPSLDEMARLALRALSEATADSEKGFFLMIEGSLIDHAGHTNDPVAQVHEVLAYDAAFSSVLDFLDSDPTPGVVVGTSDHETGGLAVARQIGNAYPDYAWYPEVLVNASHSTAYLSQNLHRRYPSSESPPSPVILKEASSYIRETILSSGLGIVDPSDSEVSRLINSLFNIGDPPEPWGIKRLLSDMISRRAKIGWSSHGHSAADVNIYASNPQHVQELIGNRENTEVGAFLSSFLGVDNVVDQVSEDLRVWGDEEGHEGWTGEVKGTTQGLDHYDGELL